MKRYLFTYAALVLIASAIWLFLSQGREKPASGPLSGGGDLAESTKHQPVNPIVERRAEADKSEDAENEALARVYAAERARDRMERIKQEDRDYNTLITFYGIVLDEKRQPIGGASIAYACVEGSFQGERLLQSTNDGRFTISGVRGKHLRIGISHAGYYNRGRPYRYYYYAGANEKIHQPDSAHPEIFSLLKKGEAAELIHREDQILFKEGEQERSFSLIDHSRRRDRPEYVIIRAVDNGRINRFGKRVLDLELSVPEGGIQLRADPFQFIAPSDGYQASLITPPAAVNTVDFFVHFESGNYGRFTIAGGSGQYDVDSYLNPDRSPNLEYDREKQITVVQTGRPGVDLLYPAKKEEPKKP
jgi:hypothetical protein